MPALHSAFLEREQNALVGGFYAPSYARGKKSQPSLENQSEDIIEEALNLFRPNSFCKSFDIRGPADRTLVYLLLLIGDLLGRLRADMSRSQAQRTLHTHLTGVLGVPGESGFPLNGMFPAVATGEREALRTFLAALRTECAARLLDRVYGTGSEDVLPSPWWMSFQKRRFMNKSL